MSWRTVVVSKPSKLDYSMGCLCVRDVEKTLKVHLSEISVLIIENTACSVTCALLSQLANKKIKVIFCDEKRNRLVSLFRATAAMIAVKSLKIKYHGPIVPNRRRGR